MSSCDKESSFDPRLTVTEETVKVKGLHSRHDIFFLADSHISLCDERDPELMEKAVVRGSMFTTDDITPQDRFDLLIDAADSDESPFVLLGGDIIDSAMYASIDYVRDELAKLDKPYVYYMGNHDFEYGDEYFSQKAYSEYLPRLDDLRGHQSYQISEYDDLVVFAADDHNSQVDADVLKAFKDVIARGKPVVVALHVPIESRADDALIQKCEEVYGKGATTRSQLVMGSSGCVPNAVTQEFIDLILADDSPVVLVLAGHLHFYHKGMLNDRVLQIVTGPAFSGEAVKIRLKPSLF
ncbi:MAG: metallophosphoesterase [Lachnospiraceae bacterium]|nr:metallophosphoesterase [Lachnospiraceae bacterium]